MSLRSILAAVTAALTLALPLAASAQNAKFGYVDYRRVLEEVEDGKAAKNRLEKWLAERQKELKNEETAIIKEREVLQKQASSMNEDVLAKKGGDLQKRYLEFMQKQEQARIEVVKREQQEMDPINDKVDRVIGELARRDGFAFIFEKRESGMIYAQTQYDITNEVIRAYNALPKNPAPKSDAPKSDAPKADVPKDAPVAKDAPKK
jgi:outer membrane protein